VKFFDKTIGFTVCKPIIEDTIGSVKREEESKNFCTISLKPNSYC